MQITSVQSNAHTLLIQGAGGQRSVGNAEGHHYIKTRNQSHRLLNLLPAAKLCRMMRKNNPHACCENRNVENRCGGIRAVSITIRPLSWTESVRKLLSVIRFRSITLFMPNTYYLLHIRKKPTMCTDLYQSFILCSDSYMFRQQPAIIRERLRSFRVTWNTYRMGGTSKIYNRKKSSVCITYHVE
jgi:hypothetical protein